MAKILQLEHFTKGWFIGNFEPSLLKTSDFEVAIKNYSKGDVESSHFHKKATEITFIIGGKAKMRNQILSDGQGFILDPGDVTSFEAITDCKTVVIKFPSVNNDKFIV